MKRGFSQLQECPIYILPAFELHKTNPRNAVNSCYKQAVWSLADAPLDRIVKVERDKRLIAGVTCPRFFRPIIPGE